MMPVPVLRTRSASAALALWLGPVFFFAYQFILRLLPGLLMTQTMERFSIDATSFGLLASAYYYGYAGMQIPWAMLLERYTPYRIVAASATLCLLSSFIFLHTDSWTLALVTRFCIGAASSAAFLATAKAIDSLFDSQYYGRMIGLTFSIGLLGAVYGGQPVNSLLTKFGLETLELVLTGAALLILFYNLLLPVLFSNRQFHSDNRRPQTDILSSLSFLRQPSIILLALANLLLVGSLEGFADIWGPNYLADVYQISKGNAAALVSYIFIGMIFGGPVLSFIARRIGNYTTINLCGIGITALFTLLLNGMSDVTHLQIIFFILGIFCCYQVVVFAAGQELTHGNALGTVTAFLNCINMLGGSFFHLMIGWVMDLYWQGSVYSGIRVYGKVAYQHGLSVIPVSAIAGVICVSFVAIYKHKGKE